MALVQVRQGELAHQERGPAVVSQRRVEVLDAVVLPLGDFEEDTGDVAQHVEAAEPLDGAPHRRSRIAFVRHVAAERRRFDPVLRRNRCDDIIHRVARQPDREHPRAFAGELVGRRLGNAGARARDERDLALQPTGHGVVS